jgi:hypothetical protein
MAVASMRGWLQAAGRIVVSLAFRSFSELLAPAKKCDHRILLAHRDRIMVQSYRKTHIAREEASLLHHDVVLHVM